MIRIGLSAVILFLSCSAPEAQVNPSGNSNTTNGDIHVLYVGNSLTYTNDLPAIVAEIGMQDKIRISYQSLSLPGYSLEDHWHDGNVQKEISNGNYDFVVLQQGPSALPESQVLLLEYAEKFAALCAGTKTKTILYMVWPSKDRLFDLNNVIYSYTNAATKTKSLLAPAGLAWKNAWKANPSLPLYGPDNFHPSTTGSVLAALTVYGTITNKTKFDFVDFNTNTGHLKEVKSNYDLLSQAATEAMTK